MVAQLIVEKYKQREREIGIKIGIERGREELQREWESWHERQQAALREGRTFDEPMPGHSPKGNDNGKGAA